MKIKYCNKQILDTINKWAIKHNYNRSVRQEFIDSLPDDLAFPITMCFLHEHAAGQPVDPHMRCRIMTGQSLTGPFTDVFVDVYMAAFDLLPEMEVRTAKREKVSPNFSDN